MIIYMPLDQIRLGFIKIDPEVVFIRRFM